MYILVHVLPDDSLNTHVLGEDNITIAGDISQESEDPAPSF